MNKSIESWWGTGKDSSHPERKRARAPPLDAFPHHLNKRGMMDDLFDFLFTVLISFFVLFFINGVLDRGIQASHSATRTEIAQFREQASALTHLAIQAQQPGGLGEIKAEQLDQKLEESRVIAGKTITICEDYETKVDCENDPLKVRQFKVGISEKCRWKNNKCLLQSR